MLTPTEIETLAECLLRARRGGPPVAASDMQPSDITEHDAYRIQAAVGAASGPVGAWKTGRKSPDAVPIMAPIFAATLRRSPAVFRPGELRLIGLEVEIAFRVDAELPPSHQADFEARAAERVSALAAIEVVDTRFADWEAAAPMWRLADNQINGGLVVGDPVPDWRGLDVETAAATLTVDGRRLVCGRVPVPGGSAFRTFCAFARRVGDHCGGLRVGHVVTTGSLTGMEFVERGAEVLGEVSGLGQVAVSFPAP